MIPRIYVEEAVLTHPRSRDILSHHPRATIIPIKRYTEIFNQNQQNFRLQKQRPSLILAHKHNHFVQQAPEAYGIGGDNNYYFSHMLNCLYDCRYCFLQGMYRSAHYLVFVNFETYLDAIEDLIEPDKQNWFFSGYDADSLVLDPVTGFVDSVLPFFAKRPDAWLELRTKSTQIKPLLQHQPLENVVTAFSFTPEANWRKHEHKVPTIEKRINAMLQLQQAGWPLGLRFDPLIYQPDYAQEYAALFKQIFAQINTENIHSVTIGPFRMPKQFHRTMENLYPEEALFVAHLEERNQMISYPQQLEEEMITNITELLTEHLPSEKLFPNLPH